MMKVVAVAARTLACAQFASCEALAVQFQAFGFAAVAWFVGFGTVGGLGCTTGHSCRLGFGEGPFAQNRGKCFCV